jgi:hypothetical protein
MLRRHALSSLFLKARESLLPLFRFLKRGMERRETPGVCETPLANPCDRVHRAPKRKQDCESCSGARAPHGKQDCESCHPGAAPPGAPLAMRIVGAPALFIHRTSLEMTRDDQTRRGKYKGGSESGDKFFFGVISALSRGASKLVARMER